MRYRDEQTRRAATLLAQSDLFDGDPGGGLLMEATWRARLVNQQRYRLIAPQALLAPVDVQAHGALLAYLARRYW